MIVKGTVRGKLIELDEPLPLAEGTRVEVTVTPETKPRKGSPEAVLQLAGTLTPEEAEIIMQGVQAIRQIDWELWEEKP
ncbi:MAG: hypothetical protein N2045_11285 [Fimbriimonadales bacterium]|nr:hypothetical protein [Fimbriimonadales bacterium]GBC90417.1 hypothetical protein HRbin14_01152 [bacterium HR14]